MGGAAWPRPEADTVTAWLPGIKPCRPQSGAIVFEPDDSHSVLDVMLMNELKVPPPKNAS